MMSVVLILIYAVKSGYQPDAVWRIAPGSPRNSWIMQIGTEYQTGVEEGTGSRSSWRVVAMDLSCPRVIMMMMMMVVLMKG